MLKCPSCDADLKQDFGMVTCHECQSVLMIDITGQVSVGTDVGGQDPDGGFNENTDESFDPVAAEGLDQDSTEFEASDFEEVDDDTLGASDNSQNFEKSFEDPANEDDYEGDDTLAPVDQADFFGDEESIEEELEAQVDDDATSAHGDPLGEEGVGESSQPEARGLEPEDYLEEVESFPMASEPDPNPVDVTSFANSEESSLEEGELMYDIFLGRLDSKDLKESLKYILIDEKLQLNHLEYLRKIKDGKVTLPDLNPIKAKRIVEQLQYLDLDIKWKQKRVIMELVEPEVESEEEVIEDAEI